MVSITKVVFMIYNLEVNMKLRAESSNESRTGEGQKPTDHSWSAKISCSFPNCIFKTEKYRRKKKL